MLFCCFRKKMISPRSCINGVAYFFLRRYFWSFKTMLKRKHQEIWKQFIILIGKKEGWSVAIWEPTGWGKYPRFFLHSPNINRRCMNNFERGSICWRRLRKWVYPFKSQSFMINIQKSVKKRITVIQKKKGTGNRKIIDFRT